MKKSTKGFALAAALLLLVVPVASAAGHQNIVEILLTDGRFTTLVAAVLETGLDEALSDGTWTVFAPTDAAFAKLGLNANNVGSSFTTAELTDLLLYHTLPEDVTAFEAKASTGDLVMTNGKITGLKVFDGDLYLNDESQVIEADIVASNGVIHVVDNVILPPWPRVEEPEDEAGALTVGPIGNIVEVLALDGRFTTLVAAVKAADLADDLSTGEWTVFAPTDDAFARLDVNAGNVATAFTKGELVDLLLYHALPTAVTAFEARATTGDILMANGEIAGLKVFEGHLYLNDDAMVVDEDILATNGVIHALDFWMARPWPKTTPPVVSP